MPKSLPRKSLLESQDRNIRKLKLTKCAPILRFAGSAFLRVRVGIDNRWRRARAIWSAVD